MTDSEILKKLNNLKNLQPDKEWKSSNRDLLFSQVSASGDVCRPGFFVVLKNFFSSTPQPVLIGLGIFVFMVFGLAWGGKTYGRPDNSLYIARTLYERFRVSTTNNISKQKVEATIAASRAKDIVEVMAKGNEKKQEKLNQDLQVEISKMKEQLEIFSANAEKEEQGIEVAEQRATNTKPYIIEEAEKLVEEKNYSEALKKLEEVSELIK